MIPTITDLEQQMEAALASEKQHEREMTNAQYVTIGLAAFAVGWGITNIPVSAVFLALAFAGLGIYRWCRRLMNQANAEKWRLIHELGRRKQEEWDAIEERIVKESGVYVKRVTEHVNGTGKAGVQ